MARDQIQLSIFRFQRKLAADSTAVDLDKGDGSGFSGGSNQRNGHFIGNIEGFDQNVFVAFETRRIFHQNLRKLIKTGVVHRLL